MFLFIQHALERANPAIISAIAAGLLLVTGSKANAQTVQFVGVVPGDGTQIHQNSVSFSDEVAVIVKGGPRGESRVSIYDETSGHVMRTHRSRSGMVLVPLRGRGSRVLRVCIRKNTACERIHVTRVNG